VPLSEHEQRMLEQLERALSVEDPKFASTLQGADLRALYRRRMVGAATGVVIGASAAVAGGVLRSLPLTLIGVLVALLCAWLTLLSWRRMPAPGEISRKRKARQARGREAARSGQQRPRSGFMRRFEARWDRRRDRDGF
jgi:hypothetical protein